MKTTLLEKLVASEFVKKFSTLYGTRRFIIIFISPFYYFLSWASRMNFKTLHPVSLCFILILYTHLRYCDVSYHAALFPEHTFPATNDCLFSYVRICPTEKWGSTKPHTVTLVWSVEFCVTWTLLQPLVQIKFEGRGSRQYYVRFEAFTAVTMKNSIFWDVVPYRSCANRYVPPKRQFTQDLHGAISQKTEFFTSVLLAIWLKNLQEDLFGTT
jgi:hypothetical protein